MRKRKRNLQPALGQRVREAREAAGLSQTAAAAKAGMTNVYLCEIEAGRATPSLGTLDNLAEVVGTTAAKLIE